MEEAEATCHEVVNCYDPPNPPKATKKDNQVLENLICGWISLFPEDTCHHTTTVNVFLQPNVEHCHTKCQFTISRIKNQEYAFVRIKLGLLNRPQLVGLKRFQPSGAMNSLPSTGPASTWQATGALGAKLRVPLATLCAPQ